MVEREKSDRAIQLPGFFRAIEKIISLGGLIVEYYRVKREGELKFAVIIQDDHYLKL